MRQKNSHIVEGKGPSCHRCGEPTVIYEHDDLSLLNKEKNFYTRWYVCENPTCKTTYIMPKEFKVKRDDEMMRQVREQLRED